jgi:hypothetical protein
MEPREGKGRAKGGVISDMVESWSSAGGGNIMEKERGSVL